MTGESIPVPSSAVPFQPDLQFVLQAARFGVWQYDPTSGFVHWDEPCQQLFGIKKNENTPYQQAIEHIHPQDRSRVDEAVKWATTSQSDGIYDQTYRTLGINDGQLRWVRFQGRAYFTPTGELERFGGVAQEVSQQVLQHQQLADSEGRFRSLVAESPVATMLLTGPDHVIELANPPMIAMLGKGEGILGKPALEAVPELANQEFLGLLNQVFSLGKSYQFEAMPGQLVQHGVSTTHYFDFTYKPVRTQAGEVYGVLATAVDVTPQVLSHQALQASETSLRSLIEQAPVAIGLLEGRQLRIQTANARMIAIWGKGPSVIGHSLDRALPELQGQPFLALLDEVYSTGVPFSGQGMRAELVVDGQLQTFYYDFTYQPIRDGSNQVYAVLNVAVDVTQQVKLGQQLQQTQNAVQNAVDLAQLGIWKIDVATGHADFSPLVAEWVGCSGSLSLAAAIAAIEPADLPLFEAAYQQAHDLGQGGRLDVEYRLQNQLTGQVYLLHSVGQMQFDDQNQPVTLSGFSQDITQLRAAQVALEYQVQQRTQELQLANRDLTRSNDNLQQFAYVASHDLQEPLRKIQSFSTLLEQQLDGQLDESARTYLQRISAAGARMSTLIKDLLTYSRIATRQQAFGPVSLQAIVAGVVSTLDWQIEQAKARIRLDDLPIVNGDESQLSQLFQNLLTNALKFVVRGQPPQVHIQYFYRSLSDLPAQAHPSIQTPFYHQISVRDEGVGFDPKYGERIFQVFQRLHGNNEYTGTGVGLAICQRVVENHGGAIRADSQPGRGSTFCVYLPA